MRCVTTMKITDKKELMKLVSFISMCDGGLYINGNSKNGNAMFIMNMLKEHIDYVEWCKSILENITSCKIYDNQEQVRLESNKHPFFTRIHDRIYVGKYKSLDPHAFKLFDAQCLAIMFMADGCATYKKDYLDISLNLKRLSYGDQLFLKKVIKDKFNLEFNIQRQNQYYYLRLLTKHINAFMDIIKPFVFDSFMYKIKYDLRTINSIGNMDDDIV